MKHLRLLPALLICILGGTCGWHTPLQADEATPPPLYLVLFRVTLDTEAKAQDLEKLKVIDLMAAARIAVSMELPKAFTDNALKQLKALDLKSGAVKGQSGGSTLTTFMHVLTPKENAADRISFAALEGALNTTTSLRLLGKDGQMSSFGKDLGGAAFFVMYYALPELPMQTQAQREALIEAEIQRNLANVQNAEILSQKDLSDDSQTIKEITARSPRNKALSIRSRYLCGGQKMLALVAITPAGLPAADIESFERLFTAFRFR